MHKKLKNIIAITLVIASVSGFVPSKAFVLGSVEAYASTYNNAKDGELKSLDLTWGSSNKIKLLDSYYSDEIDLSDKKDYYVLLKSISYFNIVAEVKGSGYVVKLFTSSSKAEKGQEIGHDINIKSSYQDIYLRTYKSEEAYEAAYDDGDISNCERTYVIHVRKAVAMSEKEQDREYAYLDGITLSDGTKVTESLIQKIFQEELAKILTEVPNSTHPSFMKAAQDAERVFTLKKFPDFLAKYCEKIFTSGEVSNYNL